MPLRYGPLRALLTLSALSSVALAAPPPEDVGLLVNGDFELGEPGEVLPGWAVPSVLYRDGYRGDRVQAEGCGGNWCVGISWTGEGKRHTFANLMQAVPADALRGRRIRVEARVRLISEDPQAQAQAWLRVDRDGGEHGYFDNMHERPVRGTEWQTVRLEGPVAWDADDVNIGFMTFGDAQLLVDDVTLSLVDPRANRAQGRELAGRVDDFVAAVDARRAELDVPGAVLGVVIDGKLVRLEALGQRDPDDDEAPDPQARFLAASVSKPVAATAIATVVDEGALAWDTPVQPLVPGYQLSDPDRAATVTMTDLLAHRLGMARADFALMTEGVTLDTLLGIQARALPLTTEPQWPYYDNLSYTVAGQAAAAAVDQSWSDLLTERVLEPLEMRHSSALPGPCLEDPALQPGWERIAAEDGWVPATYLDTEVIAPAGGLCTTVPDLARWVGALQSDSPRWLDRAHRADLWSGLATRGAWAEWGRGWRVDAWGPHAIAHHEGNLPGHGTAVGLMPEEGIGWVLFINTMASPLLEEVRHIASLTLLDADPAPELAPLAPGAWPLTVDLGIQVHQAGDGTQSAEVFGSAVHPLVQSPRGWRVQGTNIWLSGEDTLSPGLSMPALGLTLPPGLLDPNPAPALSSGIYTTSLGVLVVDQVDGVPAVHTPGGWLPLHRAPEPMLSALVETAEVVPLRPTPTVAEVRAGYLAALGPTPLPAEGQQVTALMELPNHGLVGTGTLTVSGSGPEPAQHQATLAISYDELGPSELSVGPDGAWFSMDGTELAGKGSAAAVVIVDSGPQALWRPWVGPGREVRVRHRDVDGERELVVLRFTTEGSHVVDVSFDRDTWLPTQQVLRLGHGNPLQDRSDITQTFEGWTRMGALTLPTRITASSEVVGQTVTTLGGPELASPAE